MIDAIKLVKGIIKTNKSDPFTLLQYRYKILLEDYSTIMTLLMTNGVCSDDCQISHMRRAMSTESVVE